MTHLRNLLLATTLTICTLAGCSTLARNWRETSVGPEVAAISGGAAAVAVNPANVLGWWEIGLGIAGVSAAILGGPKALAKVRAFRNRGKTSAD